MPSWTKAGLDRRAVAAVIDSEPALRRVDKTGRIDPSGLTPQAVFEAVVGYGLWAGLGKITPTIYGGPSPSSPTRVASRLSRSRFPWGMPRSRLPSATWNSGRTSTTLPAIG